MVIASIYKAVLGDNLDRVVGSGPWDVLVFDERHHLSDWNPSGGKPNQSFRLVSQLVKAQAPAGRLILIRLCCFHPNAPRTTHRVFHSTNVL